MKKYLIHCFTVIELLVIVMVVAIISSFFYGSANKLRDEADFTRYKLFAEKVKSVLAENIVGNWAFSEGTGATTYDLSGNANNGTITGAEWKTLTECVYNNCLYFDGGLGDYVQFSAISSLSTAKPFVLSAWVYPEAGAAYRTILGYDSTHRLLLQSDGRMLSQQDGNFNSSGAGDVPNNKWSYVVYWYNGAQERWYINNVQSGPSHDTVNAEWDAAFKAGQHDLVNYPFKGKIDEVVVYDYALSLSEIRENYLVGINSLFLTNIISEKEYAQRIKELTSVFAINYGF